MLRFGVYKCVNNVTKINIHFLLAACMLMSSPYNSNVMGVKMTINL